MYRENQVYPENYSEMKPQTKAVNVLEKTSEYLKAGLLKKQPAWYHVVGAHPPKKNFIRQARLVNPSSEQSIKEPEAKKRFKRGKMYDTRVKEVKKDIYNIPKLRFVEDELRNLFYSQHPWELARPRILLENTGEDSKKQDWSSLIQLNKQLDGESVVQRAIYLMNENKDNKDYQLLNAYETARYEFYRLRIEEEIEQQVSKEENEMYGAGFRTSPMEHGIAVEQRYIDDWKTQAVEATKVLDARNVSPEAAWGQEN